MKLPKTFHILFEGFVDHSIEYMHNFMSIFTSKYIYENYICNCQPETVCKNHIVRRLIGETFQTI